MTSEQALIEANEKYPNDKMYKTMSSGNLTMPEFVSGNRLNMWSSHLQQYVPIEKAESPNLSTGFEKAFGQYTDSYAVAQADFRVIAVIPKFMNISKFNYIYVVQNVMTKVYDVIEVKHYCCLSEDRGYLRPYTPGDMFNPGDIIKKGSTLYRSNNHDEYGNYRYGVNAKAAYISIPETEEDGIVIRAGFRERFSFYDMVKTPITLNKNQKLLNLYGDSNNYKCFPDLGEEVKDGILFARRSINYANIAAECTTSSLSNILTSDEICKGGGVVGDIDIWVNDTDEFQDSGDKVQIYKYYRCLVDYYTKVYNILNPIVNARARDNVQYTYQLRWTFEHALRYLSKNNMWTENNNNIEFAYIEIFTYEKKYATDGYKITDRFGSKGVITHVWPDEYMPRDEYGNVADLILSPPGSPGRANPGQNYEQEFNFVADEVFKKAMKIPDISARTQYVLNFYDILLPKVAVSLRKWFSKASGAQIERFYKDIVDYGPVLVKEPFDGEFTPEKLEKIYNTYKIKPSHVLICREFKDPLTALKLDNLTPVKTTVDEELDETFVLPTSKSMSTKDRYGISPYDIKKGTEYTETDVGVIPDGNGGYHGVNLYTYSAQVNDTRSKKTAPGNVVRAWINERGHVVRQYKSISPVIIGKKYYILLKQMPDEKFSARSVGSVNQVGIPNKIGRQTKLMSPYAKNAIRLCEMDNDINFTRVDPLIENRFMATHSTSPELCEKLAHMVLTEDPFQLHDLDIKDEEIMDTVPAIMLHSILYSMVGVEISDIYEGEEET